LRLDRVRLNAIGPEGRSNVCSSSPVADMTRAVNAIAASVAESLTSDSIEVEEGELCQTDHDGPHSECQANPGDAECQANPGDDNPSVGYRLWDIVDNRLMEKYIRSLVGFGKPIAHQSLPHC
jgi:hypothetical protein